MSQSEMPGKHRLLLGVIYGIKRNNMCHVQFEDAIGYSKIRRKTQLFTKLRTLPLSQKNENVHPFQKPPIFHWKEGRKKETEVPHLLIVLGQVQTALQAVSGQHHQQHRVAWILRR
ncbi:uncharacterized protein LJ206_012311 isoform 1-T1 [Theristicus caerulescens]